MKTQCLPRLFTGTPSIRFPPVWHILTRLVDGGGETAIVDSASGALVYRDHIRVESVNAVPLLPSTEIGSGPKSKGRSPSRS